MMRKQLLRLQMADVKFPSAYDFDAICSIRGLDYFKEEKSRFKSLDIGTQGERKVLQYLEDHSPKDWIVLQNIWLKNFDRFECDLILLTRYQVFVIEVKTYQGLFVYEDGRCFYNQTETSLNPFEQIRANHIHLKNMCRRLSPNIGVQSAVIFAGDDHEVVMKTPLEEIRVVTRNGIRNFIFDIIQQEKRIRANLLDKTAVIEMLEHYEINNPFQPQPLKNTEIEDHIRPGIYCANCHSFQVEIMKNSVICSCGLHESREEAIVRTICDYGVLTYNQPLMRKHLLAFMNQQVSPNNMTKFIHKHFKVIKNSSYTSYINYNLPYHRITNKFVGIKPRIYYKKNGDIIISDN